MLVKLLSIQIYGYGKLENVIFNNLQEINVFYGENEAGKSTIMSFIHSILFGFPTKQQNELRFEPKKGAKYGGQLILQFKDKGKVVVERVKGKAVGDVKILLEDGTVGGDELLQDLLSQVDKSLYQAVFSFNIHGLQNVHQLKSEDLGKFLFSTGAIGTDRLLTVEQNLQKDMDQLFKPNGKKPYINEKLKEIKSVYDHLKMAEKQNIKYGELLKEKEQLEQNLNEKQVAIHRLQQEIHQLEEWGKLKPIVTEKELLQAEMESINISFPIDGLSRYEVIQQLLKPLEAQIGVLNEKKLKLVEGLEENQPNHGLLKQEASIHQALEKLPLYDTLKEEEREWQAAQRQALSEIEEMKDRLHIPKEQLEESNTSIFMKEKTTAAEKKQALLKEKKIELDEQFATEKEGLERIEVQIAQLEEELLPERDRQEKKQRLVAWKNKDSVEKELQSTQDKLHFLQMTATKEKELAKQNHSQHLFLFVIFIILTLWGFYQSQWLLATIGGVGIGFILLLFLKNRKTQSLGLVREIEGLKQHEQTLNDQLRNNHSSEMTLIEEQLRRDSALLEQLSVLKIKWEQQNVQYERVILAYESWEKTAMEHEKLLIRLGKELLLPNEIALTNIHTAFLLIERLKECLREYHNLLSQIEKKKETIENIEEGLRSLSQFLDQDAGRSVHQIAFLLRDNLSKERSKQQQYDALLEKYDELTERLEALEKEHELLEQEKNKLFSLAEVETEEDFRLVGKEAEKLANLASKIEEFSRQMEISSLKEDTIRQYMKMDNLSLKIEETTNSLTNIIQENQETQQALADIKYRIGLLEEGGLYGELLHTYRQLQSELDLEAKRWAKLVIAKEMLNRTVERFKQERLPSMLKKAEEYLAFLTDGNYVKMYPKLEENGFVIERKDHLLFDANELSQATTEQVYVALRLALATTIYKKYPFPIMIDDSFVNFDHVRTAKVIELLKKLPDNQILFFTCHQHLLPQFEETDIIVMKEKVSDPIHSI